MKKVLKSGLPCLLALTILVGMYGCKGEIEDKKDSTADAETMALLALNNTSLIDPILVETGAARDVSIADVMVDMFNNPTFTVKCKSPGDTSRMIATFSGSYRLEPRGEFFLEGTVSYTIKDGSASLKTTKGIDSDGIQYYALCMAGYY